jgi:hypothetical protein
VQPYAVHERFRHFAKQKKQLYADDVQQLLPIRSQSLYVATSYVCNFSKRQTPVLVSKVPEATFPVAGSLSKDDYAQRYFVPRQKTCDTVLRDGNL